MRVLLFVCVCVCGIFRNNPLCECTTQLMAKSRAPSAILRLYYIYIYVGIYIDITTQCFFAYIESTQQKLRSLFGVDVQIGPNNKYVYGVFSLIHAKGNFI